MKKLKDRPFALIGVNANRYDARKLKDVMDKEKLNWRSFADPGGFTSGIPHKWNLVGTPTLYVIDHKGVIRHKWLGSPGEEAIDKALNKLIKEAETDKK